MRRTIFLALLAALLLVPGAAHAAGPNQIIRDCEDDDVLQGNYTASELRNARGALPTDIDEYSDCRDVLSRALAAKASTSGPASSTGGDAQPSGGAGAGGGEGGGGGAGGHSGGSSHSAAAVDPGIETGPVTPADAGAVAKAGKEGERSVDVSGRSISPRLATQVGRNGLPSVLVVVLALLGAAALAAGVPIARRRVFTHRQP